jgi:ribonuclease III
VSEDLGELCEIIGYQFKDMNLLRTALTHRSVASQDNNERLEFLGDSIVNFIIAKAIYRQFPKAKEGELSRLRANLVNGETLAEIAKEIEIGRFLLLGPGELKTGGEFRTSTLADAFEAVVAAIYFDAGDIKQCESLIVNLFEDRLKNASLTVELKDQKTQLQEYLQALRKPLPSYRIAMTKGLDHQQIFSVECVVEGIDHVSNGSGTSRRRAEQAAAKDYLLWLKSSYTPDN